MLKLLLALFFGQPTPVETTAAALPTCVVQPAGDTATTPGSPTSSAKPTRGRRKYAEKTTLVRLNLTTATLEQWQLLPGVGPATAARIVETRDKRAFRKVSDLRRVKGVGKKTLDRWREQLSVDQPTVICPQDCPEGQMPAPLNETAPNEETRRTP